MDTSLAEEVQHTATTLPSDSFFFMSPYRSFTTSGCFPVSLNPPRAVITRRGSSSRNWLRLSATRRPAALPIP